MSLHRLALIALCALGIAAGAQAQMRAPKGPVEITVGSGPGGTPDVIMRNIVKIMTEQKIVTIPVVVQNRTGGSHSNAYNYVLSKKGDENVLLTLASPVFTTPIPPPKSMNRLPSTSVTIAPSACATAMEVTAGTPRGTGR